ncbi:hypothetical protein CHUAL_000344 [Chamberlinius hualienensis]
MVWCEMESCHLLHGHSSSTSCSGGSGGSNGNHGGYRMSCIRWLASIKIYRLIVALLIMAILVSFVAHYYVSKMTSDDGSNTDVHRTRSKLEAIEEPSHLKLADLKLRVEELLRIKGSVANELRDLENKRQKHVREISLYNQKIDELKMEVSKYQQELERLKLSVEQAKFMQKEALRKNTPDLQAPKRILPSIEDLSLLPMPSPDLISKCQMSFCFDHSRCSITSGFPVYYYDPEDEDRPPSLHLEQSIKSSVAYAFSINPHITFDPHVACIFVVLLSGLSKISKKTEKESESAAALEKYLHSLTHWQGDGRNHVLILLDGEDRLGVTLSGVNTGRALVVSSNFKRFDFRVDFDIVMPALFSKDAIGNYWEDLPPYSPVRRNFFISFQGKLSSVLPHIDDNVTSVLRAVVVNSTEDKFHFEFDCPIDNGFATYDFEWAVCNTATAREDILKASTFSLILSPANWSQISTTTLQVRLYESLKCGAVPVFLGDSVRLPFDEFIDWRKAAIVLPKARVTELHFLLRSFTDADILAMRHQCRMLWERYFCNTPSVVDTVVATVRFRLGIPALPVRDELSPSVFNSSFVPLKLDTLLPDIDPDESVGPMEPPSPSAAFRRNYSSLMINGWDMWNTYFDPFLLYPHTPFDPILSSEAKFLGSGMGFRPIGQGAGGAGKEFSEALGGNVPREQFTIVMLTYEREAVLVNSLQRLYGLPHLNKVIVVWNSAKLPSEDLRWPDIGVPIHVIKAKKNSLNNRFLAYDEIETEAVLSVDDDAHLRHDEIMFGFRVWREARNRIVGFPGRYHAWDLNYGGWLYNSNYSCELSMVLTGAAFFHKYYSYVYSNVMPQTIRDKVDEYMNCEDIAMNFLVSHMTRLPPLKVTSRWTFRCPGCPVALSEDDTHFQERHMCINHFVKIETATLVNNAMMKLYCLCSTIMYV